MVGRREITAPFVQNPVVGAPFASRAELMENLNYAAGVELAVAQEYLAAAYSLKPDNDPVARRGDLRDDVRATRAELLRIAIGEMRHIRAVNDVIRGFSDPGTFEPALRVASQLPHQNPGPFQPVNPRAATRAAIKDFIEIEAQSKGVDGLYNNILATMLFPPADVAAFVTDEWKQAIRSVIAEGEDHFETFLNIQEWLSNHAETAYLRSQAPARPPDRQQPECRAAGGLDVAVEQSAYRLQEGTLSRLQRDQRRAQRDGGYGRHRRQGRGGGTPEFPGRLQHTRRCAISCRSIRPALWSPERRCPRQDL